MKNRIAITLSAPCPSCGLSDCWAIQNASTGCVVCVGCGQWGRDEPIAVLAMQAEANAIALWVLDLVVAGVAIEMERRERAAAA